MTLNIGISPCPNDTFIFDALYNRVIEEENITFNFVFEDVEKLNQLALNNSLDIVKISYAHYFNVSDAYCLLKAGGALGHGVGPLLIAKQHFNLNELPSKTIAIPGIHTTANFLFSMSFPDVINTMPILFSDIEGAVLNEEVDAGVIIHENRFTYEAKGLVKLLDLGQYWETETGLPIPLGGIAIKRSLQPYHASINELIRKSISHAWQHNSHLNPFVAQHAQEMDPEIILQHIRFYVNEFSEDITVKGMQAIEKMKSILAPNSNQPIFAAI